MKSRELQARNQESNTSEILNGINPEEGEARLGDVWSMAIQQKLNARLISDCFRKVILLEL